MFAIQQPKTQQEYFDMLPLSKEQKETIAKELFIQVDKDDEKKEKENEKQN